MEKNKGGRPRKKIDVEQLEKLAEKQWSIEQIAAFFRVGRHTIYRRYATKIAEARSRGGAKLIDLQWKRVMEDSDRMLIHMSEHYLGQYTKQQTEHVVAEPLIIETSKETITVHPDSKRKEED